MKMNKLFALLLALMLLLPAAAEEEETGADGAFLI